MEKPATAKFWHLPVKIFVIAILLPGLLLVFVELAAKLAGAGYPSTLFVKETSPDGKVSLRANYRVGQRFFPGTLARKPLPEIMPAEKPAGRLRIFVLGESAARGEQLADFSFSRMLEAAINEGKQQKAVEVINTGIPAINSWVLREFVKEIVHYQADLIIVYAGHNEFIGPYGPAGVSGMARSRSAALTGIWASSLRLVQILKGDRIPTELASGWQGLEMFLKNLIMPGSNAINLCLDNWRANLNDIFTKAQQAGIPVIWCRVPVNQLDCPPFASDASKLNEQTKATIASISKSVESEDFAGAMQRIEEIRSSCGEHAQLSYLEGRSQLALGQLNEAKTCFKKALANDCFRIRTTDQFNDTAAECAAQNNVYQSNIESTFINNSQNGIIGSDLVYDHVHLTLKGHYLAAAELFASIRTVLPEAAKQLPEKFPEYEKMIALTGFTTQDAIDHLSHVIDSMSRPPFSLQTGNQLRLQKLNSELAIEKQRHNTESCIVLTRAAIGRQPECWAALHRLAMLSQHSPEQARQSFDQSLTLNPFNIDALNNFGLLMLAAGKKAEAEQLFVRALQIAPDFARAHYNLGLIYAAIPDDKAMLKKAIRHYQLAVNSDPAMANAWRNLANIHFKTGDYNQALNVFRQAIEANSGDVMLHIGAGNCLLQLKKPGEGRQIFAKAAELFPESPLPLYSLGIACEKEQKFAEAAQFYQKAGNLGQMEAFSRLFELHFSQKITLSSCDLIAAAAQACQFSDYSDPWLMQILAAGYLDNGQKNEAAGILHRAMALATAQGKQELAREIEGNLKLASEN